MTCSFQAGGISQHLDQWMKLTTDHNILQVVKGCKIEFVGNPPSNTRAKAYPMSNSLSSKIDDEIKSMLGRGILKEAQFDETMFLSPIFCQAEKVRGVKANSRFKRA